MKAIDLIGIFIIFCFCFLLLGYNIDKSSREITNLQLVNKAFQTEIKAHEKRIRSLEFIINETSNITVKATAYNAVPEQTDNESDVNACRKNPRIGRIAVSQDLFYKGWTCGKWISIQGLGIFQIDDVMHVRKTNQVDVIKERIKEAEIFGIKRNLNAVLLSNYGKM